jgi:hypothetical protein
LHSHGWALARIDLPAVDHYGHSGSALRLLLRRVATHFSFGTGEVLRAAIGRPHFYFILRNDKNLLLVSLVLIWWLTIGAISFLWSDWSVVAGAAALFLLPFIVMSLRWRSLHNGPYAVMAWNVLALSFLPGFLRSRVAPTHWIESTIVKGERTSAQYVCTAGTTDHFPDSTMRTKPGLQLPVSEGHGPVQSDTLASHG